jgi:hypothetical protein
MASGGDNMRRGDDHRVYRAGLHHLFRAVEPLDRLRKGLRRPIERGGTVVRDRRERRPAMSPAAR